MAAFIDQDENILFLLASAHWNLQSLLKENFLAGGFRVTPEQWQLMLILNNRGPLHQHQLAEIQQKDKASITRFLDYLEKLGMVKRERSRSDLRKKKIQLTSKGKETVSDLRVIAENTFVNACEDLSELEYNVLKRLITRLHGKK